MKSLFVMAFMVCVGPTWAQCSLPECNKTEPFGTESRPGSLVFQAPEKKWRWQPQLRVERVTERDEFWLTDSSLEGRLPTLQFVAPRTEISTRVLIYRAKEAESAVTEVSLGFHRRPKGFGLVYRRSF